MQCIYMNLYDKTEFLNKNTGYNMISASKNHKYVILHMPSS